jgi:nucleoside-diphosphate-sugar epimerase
MSNYLIAGCGYVGSALAVQLVRAGHQVFAIRRTIAAFPDGVIGLSIDMGQPFALPALPPLDGVVLSAASSGYGPEAYRLAYETVPAHLIAALRALPSLPRRVVYTSSTGVYAQTGGAYVDEDTPAQPTSFSGLSLKAGEDALLGSGLPVTVLRLGGIYGPGRARLIEEVRDGTAGYDPAKPHWSALIHVEDCAGALAHLLAHPDPAPVYLGVDHAPTLRSDIMIWLAEQLGTDPAALVKPGLESPRRGNKRPSNARLLASGYCFRYPTFREGFGALLGQGRP